MIRKLDDFVVPVGIRYLGEMNSDQFDFNKFPNRCILDKQLPGCGFTEFCLAVSLEDVILASPRIMLINNKKDQHGDDVFLVVNEMEKDSNVDKDLTKPSKTVSTITKIPTEEEIKQNEEEIKRKKSEAFEKIKREFGEYYNRMVCQNKPIKVLVTYDSYHIIKDIFKETDLNRFMNSRTVVDEFQSILHDARFKSSTEMQFLEVLKTTPNVMFASATPTMEKYINQLDEFDRLPYITIDWHSQDPTRIIKPNLEVLTMKTVGEKAGEVIQSYLDGKFESITVMRDNQPVTITSTEAVLYVNSVNHITSLIKRKELTPDQVLILCSKTDENTRKIHKRLGKKFNIGHVPNPVKGEKFPMFTFCTRTVYLGADFYSTNARTFIFSDANIDSLAVDISEDLPQILGRQRWSCNPWKNAATFYYRATANYRFMKEEDFQNILNTKMNSTKDLMSVYENGTFTSSEKYNLAKKYKKDAENSNYKDDYVGVNTVYVKDPTTGEVVKILKPKINNLVYVNELRAFDIQQKDYKDRFTVFSTVSNKIDPGNKVNEEVISFLDKYNKLVTRLDKLRLLCEYDMSDDARRIVLGQIPDNDDIKSFYTVLGPDRLHELGYNVTKIRKELGIVTFSPELLINSIYSKYHVGDRILFTDLKEQLKALYDSINYQETPKATNIFNYFEAKEYMVSVMVDGKKKRVRGYELISSREQELRDKLKAMKN